MTDQQEPLSAQQMRKVYEQASATIKGVFADIDHRKYAIEEARKVVGSSLVTPAQFIELAAAIHAFVVQPAAASTTSPPATMTAMARTETA